VGLFKFWPAQLSGVGDWSATQLNVVYLAALGGGCFFFAVLLIDVFFPALANDSLVLLDDWCLKTVGKSLVQLWMVWEALWGWLLISAVIAGISSTIFRSNK
jgi:hypothetical protein